MEGMRRLDEYYRLLEYFPSQQTQLEALSITAEDLDPEELQVLNYVNQYATLMDIIDHSKFGDLKTLQILVKLHSESIIGTKTEESSSRAEETMDYDQLAENLKISPPENSP